jgi:hypothetical protein
MSPFGNVWARYSMLLPPTFALPQKVPVREAFLAISSISLPIANSTTLWVKPVPMRCRAPWPNVIRRPSFLCRPQSQHKNRDQIPMVLNVVISIQTATGRAMVRGARITPRRVSSSPQRSKAMASGSATLTSGSRRIGEALLPPFRRSPPTRGERAAGHASRLLGDCYLRATEPAPASS